VCPSFKDYVSCDWLKASQIEYNYWWNFMNFLYQWNQQECSHLHATIEKKIIINKSFNCPYNIIDNSDYVIKIILSIKLQCRDNLILFEQSNCFDWIIIYYIYGHCPIDSFSGNRFMLGDDENGNRISWRHRVQHWKRLNRRLFLLFSDNLAVVLNILALMALFTYIDAWWLLVNTKNNLVTNVWILKTLVLLNLKMSLCF
jgi:hypothetical protein